MSFSCSSVLLLATIPPQSKGPGSPRSIKALNWSFLRVFLVSCVLIGCSLGTFVLSWYPNIFEDVLINQEFLPVPQFQELASMHHADLGRETMRKASVSIYGVGRNVFPARLESVLEQLSDIENDFDFAQTILVDGASSNGAQDVMRQWVAKSPKHRRLIVDSGPQVESDSSLSGPFVGKSMPREGRLAFARNLALKHLRTLPKTDYMIVVDLDVVGWSQVGVRDGFGRSDEWDILCANGILLHGLYRDTYAFRTEAVFTNHHFAGDDFAEYNLTAADRTHYASVVKAGKQEATRLMDTRRATVSGALPKPVAVQSCFGGLALYKSSSSLDTSCEYTHRSPGEEKRFMLDCEHVLFHQCLREQTTGGTEASRPLRVMASPHMKLWYGHSTVEEIKWRSVFGGVLPKPVLDHFLPPSARPAAH